MWKHVLAVVLVFAGIFIFAKLVRGVLRGSPGVVVTATASATEPAQPPKVLSTERDSEALMLIAKIKEAYATVKAFSCKGTFEDLKQSERDTKFTGTGSVRYTRPKLIRAERIRDAFGGFKDMDYAIFTRDGVMLDYNAGDDAWRTVKDIGESIRQHNEDATLSTILALLTQTPSVLDLESVQKPERVKLNGKNAILIKGRISASRNVEVTVDESSLMIQRIKLIYVFTPPPVDKAAMATMEQIFPNEMARMQQLAKGAVYSGYTLTQNVDFTDIVLNQDIPVADFVSKMPETATKSLDDD